MSVEVYSFEFINLQRHFPLLLYSSKLLEDKYANMKYRYIIDIVRVNSQLAC